MFGFFKYAIPGHEDSKMRSWPWWSACTGCAPKPVAWQLHQKVILLYNSCGAGPFFGVLSDRRCVRSTSLRQVDMARSTVGLTVDFCWRTRQRKGSLGSFTSVPHPRFVNHAYIYIGAVRVGSLRHVPRSASARRLEHPCISCAMSYTVRKSYCESTRYAHRVP